MSVMGGIEADKCGIHQCKASECFRLHNPTAYRNTPSNPDVYPITAKFENDVRRELEILDPQRAGKHYKAADIVEYMGEYLGEVEHEGPMNPQVTATVLRDFFLWLVYREG